MAIASSLFDVPADHPITAGSDWIAQLVGGTGATTICIIAIAFLGFMLMTGRLAVREGLRIVIGCFVLLGAPVIALGLLHLTDGSQGPVALDAAIASPPPPPAASLPPANYDPYAGASLKID